MRTTQSSFAKFLLALAVAVVALSSSSAMANGGRGHGGHGGHWGGHGGHGHGGHGHWRSGISLHLGAPLFWPYYSYAPVYYPQPVVVAPAPQVVYVEQAQAPMAPPPVQQYWYYCGNPQGYYPNVQACPGGWQKVLPQQVR